MSAELIESMSVVERASRALSKAESEAKLKELAQQSKTIVAVTDSASRTVCHDSMMILKNIRIRIQSTGKEAREDATAFSKAVIAEKKRLIGIIEPEETRLAALREEWDTAREREKEAKIAAEAARTTEIQRRIDGIRSWPVNAATQPSILVGQMLQQANDYKIDPAVFEEFVPQATEALMVSRVALEGLLAQRKAHEAEQDRIRLEREELAKLRAEAAEREAREAAARAKADEEARIERQRQEEAAKAERDRLAAIAQAERDAENARQAEANRIERERIAAEEAESKRLRDIEHAKQVEAARVHAQQLAAERAENDRIEAERRAELDRQETEARKAREAEEARLAAERAQIEADKAALAAREEAARKAAEPKPATLSSTKRIPAKLDADTESHLDAIDACVFSSDMFDTDKARARLRYFMGRWERALATKEVIA